MKLFFFLTIFFSFSQEHQKYKITNGPLDSLVHILLEKSGYSYIYEHDELFGFYEQGNFSSDNLNEVLQKLLSNYYKFEINHKKNVIHIKQVHYELKIKIIDEFDNAVFNSNIFINDTVNHLTDKNGLIQPVKLKPGIYKLSVDHISFDKYSGKFFLDRDSIIEIVLSKKVYTSKPVTIIDNNAALFKTNSENVIKLHTDEMFYYPQMLGKDLLRSIQMIPGVNSENYIDANISIRGDNSDYNLIMYDGINLYHLDHFYGFFSAINPDIVGEARVVKGVYAAKFGGKLSGLVEFLSKPSVYDTTNIKLSGDFLTLSGLIELPVTNNLSLMIAGRRSYSEIYQTIAYSKISSFYKRADVLGLPSSDSLFVDKKPEFLFYDYQLKLSYVLPFKHVLNFNYFNGFDQLNENTRYTFLIDELQNFNIDLDAQTDWKNDGFSLRYFFNSSIHFEHEFKFSKSKYGNNFSLIGNDVQSLMENTIEESVIRFDTRMQDNTVALSFGAVYDRNTVIYGLKDNPNGNEYREDSLMYRDKLSIYANYQDKIKSFKYDLGFRLSSILDNGQLFFSPRIKVYYLPAKAHTLSFSYGRFYQHKFKFINYNLFAGIRHFWVLADNSNYHVSESQKMNLAYSLKKKKLDFDIDLYVEKLNNINYSSESLYWLYADTSGTGTGINYGLEIFTSFSTLNILNSISYSYNQSFRRFPGKSMESFHSFYEGGHQLKIASSYRLKNWNFALSWSYRSGPRYTGFDSKLENSNRLEAVHSLNSSVAYHTLVFKSHLEINLNLFNLYNQRSVIRRVIKQVVSLNGEAFRFYDDTHSLGFLYSLGFAIKF